MEKLKIAFDVGACTGESLHKFKDYDIIYAFEPDWWSYEKLLINTKDFSNIKTYKIGISDIDGKSILNRHDHYMFSSFLELDINGVFTKICSDINYGFNNILERNEIQTIRLDTFMIENNINHIDLLKIDTQGYDFKVIKSLGKFITNVKKIELEIQLTSLYLNSPTKEEIVNFMIENNFTMTESTTDYGTYRENNEQDLTFENNLYR